MDYSDRELALVDVSDIRTWIDRDGQTTAVGEVEIAINNLLDPDIPGPRIIARIGVQIDADDALSEIEVRLLSAAHDLLNHLSRQPVETLRDMYRHQRDDRNKPDPMAELQKVLEQGPGG